LGQTVGLDRSRRLKTDERAIRKIALSYISPIWFILSVSPNRKDESMDDAPHNPAHIPAPGSYHWTPRLQRTFWGVRHQRVGEDFGGEGLHVARRRLSAQTAARGAAFRLGCAAALLIARGRLVDELLDRAIWGMTRRPRCSARTAAAL
jgi:hypothetical protein